MSRVVFFVLWVLAAVAMLSLTVWSFTWDIPNMVNRVMSTLVCLSITVGFSYMAYSAFLPMKKWLQNK